MKNNSASVRWSSATEKLDIPVMTTRIIRIADHLAQITNTIDIKMSEKDARSDNSSTMCYNTKLNNDRPSKE